MTDRILNDAYNLKKLIREAEALADESMIAFARLKQAMLAARQNPGVEVHTGQRALMRLNQAETQAMAMSTSLLRVHDELSQVAREKMGGDTGVPTEIPENATLDSETAEFSAEMAG
ncbi:hypothetical protein [Erythrobacter sp. JK5]|uniref:hypothetical protein n=1 Tax=Erythrobacter sp. JK5 TaxID=2829500 RepID=UPI001BA4A83B|nr:hypothetical protein [Erythrobacter sp. JK5]QUL37801.1 hypothetical protein KDC96_15960 [Erythrobacter sp. JK5]